MPARSAVSAAEERLAANRALTEGTTLPPRVARDANVANLESIHERLLRENKVELLRGHARVVGPHEVDIDGRRVTAERILVATGSRPWLPTVEGIEHAITSDGFFELKEQPREVAVIGSGYIACELAGILQALGTRVHLVFRAELPLRGFDGDLRRELDAAMRASGMEVHASSVVRRIAPDGAGRFALELSGPEGDRIITVDRCLLYATGRKANIEGLGLEDVGVGLDADGNVVSGDDGSTAVPSVVTTRAEAVAAQRSATKDPKSPARNSDIVAASPGAANSCHLHP